MCLSTEYEYLGQVKLTQVELDRHRKPSHRAEKMPDASAAELIQHIPAQVWFPRSHANQLLCTRRAHFPDD